MKLAMTAVLAAVISFAFTAEGGLQEMKNLEVNLGFAQVPDDYTCEGKNISPRIEVGGLNATSLALIVDDPDAPSGTFTHWIMWNIEPTEAVPEGIPGIPTVTKPIKALQGLNDFGRIGYLGPCPPPGRPHRYFFRVYGLDRMLDLKAGSSRRALERAMKGHVLQQGEAMATFGR